MREFSKNERELRRTINDAVRYRFLRSKAVIVNNHDGPDTVGLFFAKTLQADWPNQDSSGYFDRAVDKAVCDEIEKKTLKTGIGKDQQLR